MATDITDLVNHFTVRYDTKMLIDMVTKKKPLFSEIQKIDDFVGESLRVPILHAHGAARSATLSVAQANAVSKAAGITEFLMTSSRNYAVGHIPAEGIAKFRSASSGAPSSGKIPAISQDSITDMYMSHGTEMYGQDVEADLFGKGTGSRGVIESIAVDGLSAVLVNRFDIIKLQPGSKVVADSTDPGLSLTPAVTVTGSNLSTGTLTFDQDITATTPAFAVGNFLFHQGDNGAKIHGLQSIIPPGGPSGTDSFYGVNRSTNPTQLAGHSITASGSVYDAIRNLAMEIGVWMNGIDEPNHTVWLSLNKFEQLCKELQIDIQRNDDEMVTAGFQYIWVNTALGRIPVKQSPFCPDEFGWIIAMNYLELHTARDYPHIANDDSLVLRLDDFDNVKFWMRGYAGAVHRAPSSCGAMVF